MFPTYVIEVIYQLTLYITYNLYIKPDSFALSQIKFFKHSRLVDAPVTNIQEYSQYLLSSLLLSATTPCAT
jgi:hypothetical protein